MFYTFTFDTATKWPQGDKTPDMDMPARILEKGKYMGLGLSLLSEKGIGGKGISVAVIDKPIIREHEVFQGNLNYVEVLPEHAKMGNTHFHGAAVAGILAGKNGVAPEANLYYFAVPDDMEPYARYAEAMGQILELQNTLPKEGKIRIVAVAHGLDLSLIHIFYLFPRQEHRQSVPECGTWRKCKGPQKRGLGICLLQQPPRPGEKG